MRTMKEASRQCYEKIIENVRKQYHFYDELTFLRCFAQLLLDIREDETKRGDLLLADIPSSDFLQLLIEAEKLCAEAHAFRHCAYFAPKSLSQLVVGLLLGKDYKSIYDPFMGVAQFIPLNAHLYGNEINSKASEYASLKLQLAGVDYELSSSKSIIPSTQFDAVVAFPPIGSLQESDDFCLNLLSHFETMTTAQGEMVLVAPSKVCTDDRYYDIRKKLTDKGYISHIVQLPSNYLYNTGVAFVVIHLSKSADNENVLYLYPAGDESKDHKGLIDFDPSTLLNVCNGTIKLDRDQYYLSESTINQITRQELVDTHYDWSPYAHVSSSLVDHFYRNGENKFVMDYLKTYDGEVCPRNEKHFALPIRKFTNPFEQYSEDDMREMTDCVKVTDTVLAVGYTLRCMLYCIDASEEEPIYVSRREILYKVVDGINPQFLALYFSECYINDQAYGIPPLSANVCINKMLHPLYVSMIPRVDQDLRVEDAARDFAQKTLAANNLDSYIADIKTQYEQEVRSRKHNMRPYLRELKSATDLAEIILKEEVTSLEEARERLMPIFASLHANRKGLSEVIDHLSQVDKFAPKETIKLVDAIKDHFQEYAIKTNVNLTYSYLVVEDDANEYQSATYGQYVRISRYDLHRMMDCIFDNARRHGYENHDEGHEFIIEVERSKKELDMVTIKFMNDGKPFPKDFDINRYGLLGEKAGSHAGTGDGGHQVVSIAHHFGGYVELGTEVYHDKEYTCVSVSLPIFDKDWYEENGTVLGSSMFDFINRNYL